MLKPWAHQSEIIPTLINQNHFLIWDAGTGKTLPLLTACKERGGRALYLGPPAIRTQVAKEAEAYGLYSAKDIQVVQSSKDKVAAQAKLVILSYDHAITDKIWKQLFVLDWNTLVLDEAHFLKNTAAKRTRAVYGARVNSPGALFRKAQRVLVATATPIVNDPMDYWTHVSRLLPGILVDNSISSKDDWLNKFCHVKDTPYGPKVLGAKNTAELKTMLDPYVSRIKKENVLDIPPLLVSTLWVEAGEIDLDGVPLEALDELNQLLVENENNFERLATPLATLRRRIGLAKASHVADIVIGEQYNGVGKTILFYQHTDVGQELADRLQSTQKFVDTAVIYSGGMSQGKRDAIIHKFNTDKEVRFLIAQIQAAGTGLNLQAAQRVIIVEPAWTPALNEQAISRAYRAGQKNSVWASYVCLKDSIDEAVTSALRRKSKIIGQLVA